MGEGRRAWWMRDDLRYERERLVFAGTELAALAESAGTPTFVYSERRVHENLGRLAAALAANGLRYRIFYALKANRFAPLVSSLRQAGTCGVDVCSPREMLFARQVGFAENDISYTATSVSDEDLRWLARHPGVHVNCDSISSLTRLGRLCPGRSLGLRVNPQVGAGYNKAMEYAGERATKFGIYPDRFEEALAVARAHELTVTTLHFHIGCGYLDGALDAVDAALAQCQRLLERCPDVRSVNVGGGLGVPSAAGEAPLDLERWSALLAGRLGPASLEVQVEPGDYLVKDAGLLLARINTVEEKGGTTFVGVDAGLNLLNLAAHYGIPITVLPLRERHGADVTVTIAGNINEGIDLLACDIALPPCAEGDLVALLYAGGYGSVFSSDHCMRGSFSEYLLTS